MNGDQSDNSASARGAVYVYSRTGNSWVQSSYLKSTGVGSQMRFGISVAISDDTLATGAERDLGGAAHVVFP